MGTAGSDTFRSSRGARIFEQWWWPEGDARAVLAICHGYAEHSGRYAQVAADLNSRGYAVEALDLRGHGRSSGARVYVRSYDEFLDDLDGFLARVRARHPGKKVFLLGHSMGGGVVTYYVIARHPSLDGLLVSGALLQNRQMPVNLKRKLQMAAGRFSSRVRFPGQLAAAAISRDPEVVARYEADPLVYRGGGSAGMAAARFPAARRIAAEMESVRLPLLVMHGTGDQLTSPEGSEELFARAGSKDKTLKLYEGLYHEILNEPERGEVIADIVAWLDDRTEGRK